MKKTINILIAAIVLGTFFFSCADDDDTFVDLSNGTQSKGEYIKRGSFKIDGREYVTNYVSLTNMGPYFELLFSDTIPLRGNIKYSIGFQLNFSSVSDSIREGTFTYAPKNGGYDMNNNFYSAYSSFVEGGNLRVDTCSSGTLTVSVKRDTADVKKYKFDYNIMLGSKMVNGTYNGTVLNAHNLSVY